jgi:cyclopropane fatty-acyl-phospholipid synthase-like methyltransferase
MARKVFMKSSAGWWTEFFDEFRPLFDLIPPRQSNALARFIVRELGLKPGQRLLDCPCGIGRVALPLARMGIKVTGVDITAPYLDELKAKARRSGLKIDTVECDMRRITFDRRFHAAVNLWTSFGYFENEANNLLTLKRLYRALRPGGKLFMHLINRDWVMVNYAPHSWSEAGAVKILQEERFDFATSINHGTWHFVHGGEVVAREMMVRLYSLHELLAMFRSVGFIDLVSYGSTKREPVSIQTRTMTVIGTRPK